MANFLVKRTLASLLNLSDAQTDMALKIADSFKNNDINKSLALSVFEKIGKKTPSEINEILEKIDKVI